jgi:hypothetical protein
MCDSCTAKKKCLYCPCRTSNNSAVTVLRCHSSISHRDREPPLTALALCALVRCTVSTEGDAGAERVLRAAVSELYSVRCSYCCQCIIDTSWTAQLVRPVGLARHSLTELPSVPLELAACVRVLQVTFMVGSCLYLL